MIKRIGRSRGALLTLASVAVLSGGLMVPAVASLSFWPGDVAQVAYTNGQGINVRSAPGVAAGIVTTLPEAFAVSVLDGPLTLDDGSVWYQIGADTIEGWHTGWVSGAYLGELGTLVSEASYFGPPPTPPDVASGVPLWVSTGGSDLNLRSGPSIGSAVVASAPDGAWIEVLDVAVYDETGNAWTLVSYGGVTGYVLSSYIGQQFSFSSGTSASVELATADALAPGSLAQVTEGINVRSAPGADGGIVSTIMSGRLVWLLDGPVWDADGAAWYQVEIEGVSGWVHGGYLAAGATAGGGNLGQAIVDAALAYQGVPYVWGGTTPAGFDCSGFTYYIINQVLGNNYPRPMEDQVVSGYWVGPGELQPGDIVYFQNTYQWGLSHVGFYMGNGQFVHAGSEHWGVGIGSLYDPYWQSRYVTARRVH